ncbi:MBL fold metallo-hydrolase, partial [Patescibacteria group bacterium]|nr:MBL fold metallo-hydrolase [Patescibacteria group bacterium]
TGVGDGHAGIEKLYAPQRRSLKDELAARGVAVEDVTAVINTHLHFDHCGENRLFPDTPIHVQRVEHEAAQEPLYTIPGWIDFQGAQYELHGGAQDLIFPHHEAEIAQMEAISGKKPMARHWMHSGFLTVKGVKMSKSLGNFITIQDFLKQHSPRILRFLILKTHYRSPIDYSDKLLLQTERELARIDEFVDKLKALSSPKRNPGHAGFLKEVRERFKKALEDDFNTPKAISVLFELMNKGNALLAQQKLSLKDAKAILSFLKDVDSIFGFIFFAKAKIMIPAVILKLAEKREKFREVKEWQKADMMRKELLQKGWQIDDTIKGSQLKRKEKSRS